MPDPAQPQPRRSNWDAFRAVYERILDKNPAERKAYSDAVEHYRAEARRLRGDDGQEGSLDA
jgi:hypothetical protein